MIKTYTLKNQQAVTLRYLNSSDVAMITAFGEKLAKEDTTITALTPENIPDQKAQKKYVSSLVDKCERNEACPIIAVCGETIVGNCAIELQATRMKHVGLLGIAIDSDFRGLGLGKQLIRATIEEAIRILPGLRLIKLTVFASNIAAKKLYASVGFVKTGTIPEELWYQGRYIDHDIYVLKVNEYHG